MKLVRTVLIVLMAVFFSACELLSGDSSGDVANMGKALIGESCQTGGSDQICIGVNYVVYKDSAGAAAISEAAAAENIRVSNTIWKQCGIGFQIEKYQEVSPGTYGLSYGAAAQNELDSIRRAFNDGNTFLIATTGPWNATKNAWAQMPGTGSAYGIVIEQSAGKFGNIVAHELGHYLNLDHVSDNSNVLSAIIYQDSTELTSSQCNEARSAAKSYWKNMLR